MGKKSMIFDLIVMSCIRKYVFIICVFVYEYINAVDESRI